MRFARLAAITAAGLAASFAVSVAPASAATPSAGLAVTIAPASQTTPTSATMPGSTSIAEGTPTKFTISVTNRGPNTAPAASLSLFFEQDPNTFHLILPSSIKPVSGPYNANWAMGTLAVGQTARAVITVIGQQITGSNSTAVEGALILTATSTVPNPLLLHDRGGDTWSISRLIRTVGPLSHNPFGHLDSVTVSGSSVRVRGWAADADNLFAALPIALSNNGVRSGGFRLPVARPDVANARGTGPKPGFDIAVTAKPGQHQICAYAINYGPGVGTRLGCITVVTH